MLPGMWLRRGMRGSQLRVTSTARLTPPGTAPLEANAVDACRRAIWPATAQTPLTSAAILHPVLPLVSQVRVFRPLKRLRPLLRLPLVAGDLKLICVLASAPPPLKAFGTTLPSLRQSFPLVLVSPLALMQWFYPALVTL